MGGAELQIGIKEAKGPLDSGVMSSSKTSLACIINTEIGAVLAVMRRNVRWGSRHGSRDDHVVEHNLIHSLKSLRKQIFSWRHQWHTISPVVYLQPFLDVIKSDETGAPITGVALSSIYKIVSLDVLDLNSVGAKEAVHLVLESVTSCRFEVTDPASEEVVLMKILQVLLACMKCKVSVVLSNQDVCTIVTTCFRVVHQAGTKGELLQRIARNTMHELIRCIFSHLPNVNFPEDLLVKGESSLKQEFGGIDNDFNFVSNKLENGRNSSGDDQQPPPTSSASNSVNALATVAIDGSTIPSSNGNDAASNDLSLMKQPYGVPCIIEIFHFLCSLLNVVENLGTGHKSHTIAFDEDVPLFALGLINSAIELSGASISQHPGLLSLVQDELFRNLMQLGSSMSPLVLSMICGIVLNLYQHLRSELKLQLEAFFSCVILRLAESRYGASYQQQEVVMEALVDFCRQEMFVVEIYTNFDCDIACTNIFEEVANLLSRSAFPVNSPLSSMHILALDGLISILQGMAERIDRGLLTLELSPVNLDEYNPFWTMNCENYSDPNHWVPFVIQRKHFKRRLMAGADHFNRNPKNGLELLQGMHLLPDKLDPTSVACFLRHAPGLDKNLIGDFLGNHDEFSILVLHEFARTFDFSGMNLDNALRLFLESFRLPGESQKIQRVLEAFSERYYVQSPQILANEDAALVLSYSLILLNTDQHNVQVRKKMTEEDFIRNNRRINGGNDLPREYLSELYHSICKNEIQTIAVQDPGFLEMTPSRWINIMQKCKNTTPFIVPDSKAYLDQDMFSLISGPAIAAISVVFDHAVDEDVYQTCIDGFLAVAKISACHHHVDVLNDLVVSLCKFTTLLNPSSFEDLVFAFGDESKARMATVAVFSIAKRYGDFIRSGWKSIVGCILKLKKLGLLPSRLASDAADESELSLEPAHGKLLTNSLSSAQVSTVGTSRRSFGLMGRFSQFLSFDSEDASSQPSEQELADQQRTMETIQNCHIDSIFAESKFLQAESLLELAHAIIGAGGQARKGKLGNGSLADEEAAVFCLELLITITQNNRDRILVLWQCVYEHISNIVHSTVMPCALIEKAVFGLFRICQRLLPYKENLADELLRSLQLVLKLDARIADEYCEQITQEVSRLVKVNATHIHSSVGWRTIISLLSITARHPEASEAGFDALVYIMSDGAHLLPANYVLCVDAARQFAESRVGHTDRSVRAVDLMVGSVSCLTRWAQETKASLGEVEATQMLRDIGEMWLRLLQGLRKVCLDQREAVRNHSLLSLQMCLTGVDVTHFQNDLWLKCFDLVIFTLLDDLLGIIENHSPKEYRNMEGTVVLALKLLSKVFLLLLSELSQLTTFSQLWLGVLSRMESYMKVKFRGRKSEKLQELVPELLKNTLLVMRTRGVLVQRNASGDDSLWDLTWSHVSNIAPDLKPEVSPDKDSEPNEGNLGGNYEMVSPPNGAQLILNINHS